MFKGKKILVTGGAGSLGRVLVRALLKQKPSIVRVLDMDETGLFELENLLSEHKNVRYLLGNIREKDRLKIAMDGIDFVFHLAALKHVYSSEYNPFEAVRSNIFGIQNVIESALDSNVKKVIYTSSDKAVNPGNTMGATKLLGERLMTAANYYKGTKKTIFSSVRFGNVMGSRGSVLPLWKQQVKDGKPITITDGNATRFTMTMDEAIRLVLKCAEISKGGEVFILKMPVVRLHDLVDVFCEEFDNVKKKIIGLKPGETRYEELMTDHEAERALEIKDMFIIPPNLISGLIERNKIKYPGAKLMKGKHYTSTDERPISKQEIRLMLKKEKLI